MGETALWRSRRNRRWALFAAAVAAIPLGSVAKAQSVFTWTNSNNDYLWAEGNNWSLPGVPGSADTATFDDSASNPGGTIDLGSSSTTIDTLQFANSTNNYTIADESYPGGTLYLNTIDTSQVGGPVVNTIDSSLNLAEATPGQAIEINMGQSFFLPLLDIQGAVTAPDGLYVTGNGTLVQLDNSNNQIGTLTADGATIYASSPNAISGVTQIVLGGQNNNYGRLVVQPIDNGSYSSLGDVTVAPGASGGISIGHGAPNMVQTLYPTAGQSGLTPGSGIVFNSVTINDGSTLSLSTYGTPYGVEFTTAYLAGNTTINTGSTDYTSLATQVKIDQIVDTQNSTLTFNGGGTTEIAGDAVNYSGTTTINGGLVVLDTVAGLGTGTINVNAEVPLEPGNSLLYSGGALEVNAGGAFPTQVNVAAYAALGGDLSGAQLGVNLTLANNAILFPTTALPSDIAANLPNYWRGVDDDAGTYTVGGTGYKGAAFGSFTPNTGFTGTITTADPTLYLYANSFTAIGAVNGVDGNGHPLSGGAGNSPTFNSASGTVDFTYDGAGSGNDEIAFFQPIQGLTTLDLHGLAGGGFQGSFALEASGVVSSGQTFDVESGQMEVYYQHDANQGTVVIESGASLVVSQTSTPVDTGTYHLKTGASMVLSEQNDAPSSTANFEFDPDSYLVLNGSSIDTSADGDQDPSSSWLSTNVDLVINYASDIGSQDRGSSTLDIGDGRRITTQYGGTLGAESGGAIITANPDATYDASHPALILSAAYGTNLEVVYGLEQNMGQTVQIGDTSPWNGITQNGTVTLHDVDTAPTLNVVAGTLQLDQVALQDYSYNDYLAGQAYTQDLNLTSGDLEVEGTNYLATNFLNLFSAAIQMGDGTRISANPGGGTIVNSDYGNATPTGITALAGAGSTASFTFAAPDYATLEIDTPVTFSSTQTLKIGDTGTWNGLTQEGTVILAGNDSLGIVDVNAGQLDLNLTSSNNSISIAAMTIQNGAAMEVNHLGGTGTVNIGALSVTNGTVTANNGAQAVTFNNLSLNNASTLNGNGYFHANTVSIGSGANLSPGFSPGHITTDADTTFYGGSSYLWQVESVAGPAGTTWDLYSTTGSITFDAASINLMAAPAAANRVTLNVESLLSDDETNGDVSDFNAANPYTFTFLQAGSIVNFDPGDFIIDLSQFTNANSRNWSITESPDDSDDGYSFNINLDYNPTAIPEPASFGIFGLGFFGLIKRRSRRTKRSR